MQPMTKTNKKSLKPQVTIDFVKYIHPGRHYRLYRSHATQNTLILVNLISLFVCLLPPKPRRKNFYERKNNNSNRASLKCIYMNTYRSSYRKKPKRNNVRRAQSAAEFDPRALSAANKRTMFK